MEQNSPEWLEFRKDKIGGSDAPIIMGVSPYATPFQLWQEKLSPTEELTKNYAMNRGHQLEPKARTLLEQELGMPLFPNIKLSNQRSWQMASLDAMSFDERTVAEIKCPGAEDHQMALEGKVPEKYFPQLQHQLEVCGLDMMYYFSFDGTKGIVVKVFRDEKYIKELIEAEERFFECMRNFEAPAFIERDYIDRSSPRWDYLATRLREIEGLIAEKEMIREELIELSLGTNSIGSGLRVSKCIRKGSIDYAKVPELKSIDLEQYRKKPMEYWRIG